MVIITLASSKLICTFSKRIIFSFFEVILNLSLSQIQNFKAVFDFRPNYRIFFSAIRTFLLNFSFSILAEHYRLINRFYVYYYLLTSRFFYLL